MAASTEKQRIQQALAWKLKCLEGFKGNIYPREDNIPEEVSVHLKALWVDCDWCAQLIRKALHEIK